MRVGKQNKQPSCWIIAYGNSQRGDDGIGPFVAQTLDTLIGSSPNIAISPLPQLDLFMLEEIQGAEYILFVDACLNELKEGVCWTKVEPELNGWAAGSHHLSPDLFLGLLELLYQCRPKAWMVSIEARCFELGESLQPATRQAGERAVLQIIEWLFANSIAFSTHFPVKSITKGAELWNTQMIS